LSDDPEAPCNLMPNLERMPDEAMSLMDSIEEDPYDLSIFIDQVSLDWLGGSSLDIITQQLFPTFRPLQWSYPTRPWSF